MTIKQILYRMVFHHPMKTAKQIAVESGLNYSYLANCANESLPQYDIKAHSIIPVLKSTGDLSLLDFLEAAFGRYAVDVPEPHPDVTKLHKELFATIKRFGKLTSNAAKAMADNRITQVEAVTIRHDADALIRHILSFTVTAEHAVKLEEE